MQYTQDSDETFPYGQYTLDGVNYHDWSDAIYPYIKNGDTAASTVGAISYGKGGIYSCPSFPQQQIMNYGVNHDLCVPQKVYGHTDSVAPRSISIMDEPATKILVVEKGFTSPPAATPPNPDANADWYFETDQYAWTGYIPLDANGNPVAGSIPTSVHNDLKWDYDEAQGAGAAPYAYLCPGDMPRYRHHSICNVLFNDGHVKGMHKGSIDWYTNIYVKGAYYAQPPSSPPHNLD